MPGTDPIEEQVRLALAWLKKHSTRHDRENLARFGITATGALGVSMANIQKLAKLLGRSHELAEELWAKVAKWSTRREEFVKRAAFALLACLALHDKTFADPPFVKSLRLIERAAIDERNFVKKAVSWALRAVGRRNVSLNAAAVLLARRLAGSSDAAARWVGKDALRELSSALVVSQLAEVE